MEKKPLTPNDLVVGGRYVVNLYGIDRACEYTGEKKGEYFFKGYPFSYGLTKSDIPSSVTPYIDIVPVKIPAI